MRQLTKAECDLLNKAHDLITFLTMGGDYEDMIYASHEADQWLDKFRILEDKYGVFEVK